MVDWHNPYDISNEIDASNKFTYVVDGVYIWEFICNLHFEYGLLRGRRQWRWTDALYIACRISTISQVAASLASMSSKSQSSCKLWLNVSFAFRCIMTSITLSLYALRTIAIYKRSVFVAVITFGTILAKVILWVIRVPRTRVVWEPRVQACLRLHSYGLLNHIVMLGTELFFLTLMAGGIYMHKSGRRAFKIMYREGLLWLTLATLMQIVTVAFFALDLNDSMNNLFIIPAGILTSIGATRMYRTVSDTHHGNLLTFLETSQDEVTGVIRFRRRTWAVSRTERQSDGSASTTALQMDRLYCPKPQSEERFEAGDIEFDDESKSTRDGDHGIVVEGEGLRTGRVHDK